MLSFLKFKIFKIPNFSFWIHDGQTTFIYQSSNIHIEHMVIVDVFAQTIAIPIAKFGDTRLDKFTFVEINESTKTNISLEIMADSLNLFLSHIHFDTSNFTTLMLL